MVAVSDMFPLSGRVQHTENSARILASLFLTINLKHAKGEHQMNPRGSPASFGDDHLRTRHTETQHPTPSSMKWKPLCPPACQKASMAV